MGTIWFMSQIITHKISDNITQWHGHNSAGQHYMVHNNTVAMLIKKLSLVKDKNTTQTTGGDKQTTQHRFKGALCNFS